MRDIVDFTAELALLPFGLLAGLLRAPTRDVNRNTDLGETYASHGMTGRWTVGPMTAPAEAVTTTFGGSQAAGSPLPPGITAGGSQYHGTVSLNTIQPFEVRPGMRPSTPGTGSATSGAATPPPDAGTEQPVDPGGTHRQAQGRSFRI